MRTIKNRFTRNALLLSFFLLAIIFSSSAQITLNITTSPASCSSYGTILVNATGGTAPYTYAIVGNWTQQSGFFPTVSPGNYTVLVTDATGQTASSPVTMTTTSVNPSLIVTGHQNVTGCTVPDGTITLTASGGVPPYQYSMDGINYQTSNTFTGLHPGFYLFQVRDAINCTFTVNNFNYSLFPPNCLATVGVSFSQFACQSNGTISFSLHSNPPNPPYTFSLDGINYQPTGLFNGLNPGIHNIHFKDALGNVGIYSVNMLRMCNISLNYVQLATACAQSTGTVTLSAIGGTPPYTYSSDGVNYQSSNVFTGLTAGWHFFKVKDVNGLTQVTNAEVLDLCPTLNLTATGESCLLNDGTITATATGTAPFTYSIDGINFQSNNVFTGLAAGTYTITVRDNANLTKTKTITVPFSCLLVTTALLHPTCGNNNGRITVTASNGVAPYQYSINGVNFQSSNVFNNLAPGTYTITVNDNSGKTGTATVTLNNISGAQVIPISQSTTCANNNGSITISGSGGTIPFQYSLDGINFQAGNTFPGLSSGSYTAYIKDANGCITSTPAVVAQYCPIVTATVQNEICSQGNGQITATGSNGTAPYTFSLDGITFQASNIFPGLSAGTYTVTVKDANNVTNTVTVTINNSCPTVTVQVTNAFCGNTNGSITATGANGIAPYSYSIDGINFQLNNQFSNLGPGNYIVTVKDAAGLTNTTSTTVINIPGPQLSGTTVAASCLNNDGSVQLTAVGGTSPFRYSFNGSPLQSNSLYGQLSQGSYTAIIEDANGCQDTELITVALSNNLNLSTQASQPVCEGKTIQLSASSNGTSFQWTPTATLNNPQSLNPTASPTTSTTYYISATLGICTKTDSVLVQVLPAPVANAGPDLTICYQQPAMLQGSGGVVYSWTPSTYLSNSQVAQPSLINARTTTIYNLTVTDQYGCSSLQTDDVKITVTPMPALSAGRDTAIVMNQLFQLNAIDLNNSGFINYTWSPSTGLSDNQVSNPFVNINQPMSYTLTASTVAGCTGVARINIKVYKGPDIYVPTAFTPNNDGLNDKLKAIPVGIKQFKYFAVYNRWGEQIFYTNDPATGWDGKYKLQTQDGNLFVWTTAGVDAKGGLVVRKGTVVVVR